MGIKFPSLLFLFAFLPVEALAGRLCTCTCVVKGEDGKYKTETGDGKDRELAGESLKKALGKLKCEISPVCEGSACKADLH